MTSSSVLGISSITVQFDLDRSIDAAAGEKEKIAVASLIGLMKATGLGMSHIHLRVNAVQIHNAFRAFVHESWTHDLTERFADFKPSADDFAHDRPR